MNQTRSVFIPFDTSYARLPERFFSRSTPLHVEAPRLIRLNDRLAQDLGLDPQALSSSEGIAILSGNKVVEGSAPIAMAYAGHQFGNFVPKLGDGRALLLGEVLDRWGKRWDIHLKGSGRTPFSRSGDGRAAVGPVLREYIVSEAFAALGIPTTRALAALETGEWVYREAPLPGAIFVRLASSHIRVGTFEFFAARKDEEALRLLADYVIDRHYPDLRKTSEPYRDLLAEVLQRQAHLIARWMLIGFIHGVMNTDNTSISGETIDFGPCAFMDAYHPATVFSSIDHGGRYSYANQPAIAQWNLVRFAETLLPLLASDFKDSKRIAHEVIESFPSAFRKEISEGYARKIGLDPFEPSDVSLFEDLLTAMAQGKADFTLVFRQLCDVVENGEAEERFKYLFSDTKIPADWLQRWRKRLETKMGSPEERAHRMRLVNPVLIPRNHQIEKAIQQAITHQNFRPFHRLVEALAHPFDGREDIEDLTKPPQPEEIVHQTFCGT